MIGLVVTIVLLLPILIYHFMIWIYSRAIPRLKVTLTQVAQSLGHLRELQILDHSFAGTNWASCYARGYVEVGADRIVVYLELKYAWQRNRILSPFWRLIVRVPNFSSFDADWDSDVAQAPGYRRLGDMNDRLYPRLTSKELSFQCAYLTDTPFQISERHDALVRQAAICMSELARKSPAPTGERDERLRVYTPQPTYYALTKWVGSAFCTFVLLYFLYLVI